ncbi:hypothetical protein [Rhodoblastus sp.]|uniref:hypothetical protein n=1 Tax=Rhodoblastus sp. TaxID=1962975 RepID=UPI003F97760F
MDIIRPTADRLKIATIAELPTDGLPELTPAAVRIYERIGLAPSTTAFDLLLSLVTLTTHLALADIQNRRFSTACRGGIERAIADTIALLAARPAADEFEIVQKIVTADFIGDAASPLRWALEGSIRADARAIFPHRSHRETEAWIKERRERSPAH